MISLYRNNGVRSLSLHSGITGFLTIMFFIISFWKPVTAQSCGKGSRGASINVSATVLNLSPVELTTLHNMNIDRDLNNDTEIYISPVSGSNAGLMRADGIPNSQVLITYLMTEELPEENGNGKISIRYEMSGNRERVQEASKIIHTGEAVCNLGNDGSYYLWIGALINIANAGAGKYSGQFSMQIEYL